MKYMFFNLKSHVTKKGKKKFNFSKMFSKNRESMIPGEKLRSPAV